MGRLSSANQDTSSEKTGNPVAKPYPVEEKEDGYAGKRVQTATRDIDENIVWDEV